MRGWMRSNPSIRAVTSLWLIPLFPLHRWSGTALFVLAIPMLVLTSFYYRGAPWADIPAPEGLAGILLGVQVSILAVIFPITLALVSLLLQRRQYGTAETRLAVYYKLSWAVPLGVSSVLVTVLLSLALWVPSLEEWLRQDDSDVVLWYRTLGSATLFLWFVFNVGLTGRFLMWSLRYVMPRFQLQCVKRFLATDILPREMEDYLVKALYRGFRNGHPSINLFRLDRGKLEVSRTIRSESDLYDVWLHPLRLAAFLWKCRSGGAKNQANLDLNDFLGNRLAGPVALCWRNGGCPFSPLERFLVKIAFRFRKAA